MVGNPICVQIPWDKNPRALSKWANVNNIHAYFDISEHMVRDDWRAVKCSNLIYFRDKPVTRGSMRS